MVANHAKLEDRSKARDGCLLLWFEGNVIFSLNESALAVWSEIEKNPLGVSIEQLVDYLERYYASSVSRLRLRRDVEELIRALSTRGFLKVAQPKRSEFVYKIKADVFRTDHSTEVAGSSVDEAFAAMAYHPNEPVRCGRSRAVADTWSGIGALTLFEVLLRVLGFEKLCVFVERWPTQNERRWSPNRVREICAGVDRARLWYPKKVLCLQHSAVVTFLLKSAGIPAQMVFGARRKPFYAHAWCEVHGVVVNDEQSVRDNYPRFIRCLGGVR